MIESLIPNGDVKPRPWPGSLTLREGVRPDDLRSVREIVASSGFFSPAEVDVAAELVAERLAKGSASGYEFVFADGEDRTWGYTCFGPIACTLSSFDLYWIAVREECRGQGLGPQLMRAGEERIARAGGRRVYLDTSSRPQYAPTRRFYEKCGYVVQATLEDFYAPGDGKVIYGKAL